MTKKARKDENEFKAVNALFVYLAVHCVHGVFSVLCIVVFHEAEPARSPRLFVSDHIH